MQTRSILIVSLLVGTMAAAVAANAADTSDASSGSTATPPSQHSMPDRARQGGGMGAMQGGMGGMQGGGMMGGVGGMGGMQGGGMMGDMMGMMNGCSQMSGSTATPRLPPGNEKLQLKMRAEIMQKTGEILSKYADQLSEPKR